MELPQELKLLQANNLKDFRIMKKILTLIFILISLAVFSQSILKDSVNQNVIVIRDCRIDTLINRVINENKEEIKLNGYRVQIYSGSNMQQANTIKAKFILSYPKEDIYLIYQQPYFKVRVGNYRNRVEALNMYNKMLNDEKFKSVLLVPDEIELPKLKFLEE